MARYAKFFSLGGGGGGTNNLQLPVGTILDTTLRQVQDGLGTGSPLYISTRRVGITSDSSVTTQTSSVIQATTTNASLVIAPNGTGALIAQIPDGTTTGGTTRGTNAVDLQLNRSLSADRVATGTQSFIGSGLNNQVTVTRGIVVGGESNRVLGNGGSIVGGDSNQISGGGNGGFIGNGSSNTVSSSYSVISGGQSNTASTGSHATVIGGQSSTAAGQYAIAGGNQNTATQNSINLGGFRNNATANFSAIIGGQDNNNNGIYAFAINRDNQVKSTAPNSLATGYGTVAYLFGQQTGGGISYTIPEGAYQYSQVMAARLASLNSAATTVLSLDGTGTTNLIIPSGNNRLWAVKVVATAFVSVAGGTLVLGDSYMGEFTLLFKRVGGTSSVVGVNSANLIYDTNMATAAFTFAAGASQDLQITFKAPTTASATTFRCVAKVELVEVAY